VSSRPIEPPAECAICGADVPRNARACPECGADERTGWREQSIYDGLDLPDDDAGSDPSATRHHTGLPWYWALAGLLTLAALVILVLGLS
jgi:hypothetical protein